MKSRVVLCAAIAASLFLLHGLSSAATTADTHTLQVGDITISYPTELDAQATELARVVRQVVAPRYEEFLKLQAALADTEGIPRRVCELLGCPEHVEWVREVLSGMLVTSDMLSGLFTDWRIYEESELKATGGLEEGAIRLTYDPEEDCFTFCFEVASDDPESFATPAFMPVIVRDDGTFRTKDNRPIAEHLADGLDAFVMLAITPIHEVAEFTLAAKFKLYHPFTRWFNDGVASWVMLQVVGEIAPQFEALCRNGCFPGEEQKPLRAKVNLLAWPQPAYVKDNPSREELTLSNASYLFATEVLEWLLRDQPAGTLANIVQKLKEEDQPDTEAICRAARSVTGKDFKSLLLEYVPEYVRTGLQEGTPQVLYAEADSKVDQGDYKESVRLLSRALEMDPGNLDARFNLCWAMRKAGIEKSESERQIKIIVGLLRYGRAHEFSAFAPDDEETYYIVARVYQLSGKKSRARELFEEVLSRKPQHVDTRAALAELEN